MAATVLLLITVGAIATVGWAPKARGWEVMPDVRVVESGQRHLQELERAGRLDDCFAQAYTRITTDCRNASYADTMQFSRRLTRCHLNATDGVIYAQHTVASIQATFFTNAVMMCFALEEQHFQQEMQSTIRRLDSTSKGAVVQVAAALRQQDVLLERQAAAFRDADAQLRQMAQQHREGGASCQALLDATGMLRYVLSTVHLWFFSRLAGFWTLLGLSCWAWTATPSMAKARPALVGLFALAGATSVPLAMLCDELSISWACTSSPVLFLVTLTLSALILVLAATGVSVQQLLPPAQAATPPAPATSSPKAAVTASKLTRRDLQALAKRQGIRANLSSACIVAALQHNENENENENNCSSISNVMSGGKEPN